MVEYLSGVEGIKELFTRTLQSKEKLLRVALTNTPLVYLAGSEFADTYMRDRKDATIFLRSLRFTTGTVDAARHQNFATHYKEARTAPAKVTLKNAIVLWDNFVATVETETLGITITSDEETASATRAWFEDLWERSTQLS